MPEFDKRRSIKDMFHQRPQSFASSFRVDASTALEVSQPERSSKPNDTASSDQPTRSPLASVSPSPLKRQASESMRNENESPRLAKAHRPPTLRNASSETTKGQKSLKGFFKPLASQKQELTSYESMPKSTEGNQPLSSATYCMPSSSLQR